MIVLVSDTSVLVDLERGGLLPLAFGCGLTMVVPDLLYDRELADFTCCANCISMGDNDTKPRPSDRK